MKIGAGKVIGAVMFAAGVAAIWLWPKQKAEVSEDTVVRPVRSMVVTGKATLPELRCPGKVRAGESRDMMFEVPGRLVEFKLDRGQSVKKGDVLGWVCDILSWYLFLGGLIFMLIPSDIFASIAGRTFSFPPAVSLIAKIAAIAGAATIVLMSGRGRKNIGLRIALGAYDLYGISSWLSDVLSYSRLLALGLATGVIASVINMMASMAGGGVVGAILFILVFVIGHTLNIGINALGAYVHTNRLQFVEFFGKFYEAGGSEFSPFKTDNKYVEVKEEL